MKPFALLLTATTLTACGSAETPRFTAVDTLCTSTTRYHATQNQIDAMKQDEVLWKPLVDWLASFNKVRDAACLTPPPTSR